MAGFPENIGTPATTLTYDWILCIFWCLLVKTNLFVYDENHVFRLETFCLDRWLAGYPKNKAISAPTTTRDESNAFLVSTYQSKQLCF